MQNALLKKQLEDQKERFLKRQQGKSPAPPDHLVTSSAAATSAAVVQAMQAAAAATAIAQHTQTPKVRYTQPPIAHFKNAPALSKDTPSTTLKVHLVPSWAIQNIYLPRLKLKQYFILLLSLQD
jgi:hypothetical protein